MERGAVIHVVDDDAAVRQSLAFLLASAGYAVRLYESAEALLAVVETLQPGCVLSDVRMPGIDGLELQRRLKALGNGLPLILMTGDADVPLAVAAMKAGAVDFIQKPYDGEALLAAVAVALRGLGELAEAARARALLEVLSPREREVLQGLLAGEANKVIAARLKLSPRTIEVHRANVMAKMQVGSLSELVRVALLAT